MLDNSNLREPFDVNTIEEEISEVVKTSHDPARTRPRATVLPRREIDSLHRLGLTQRLENNTAMDQTETLLNDRGTTHGSFENNARVCQAIKRQMRAEGGWELLTDVEREAMDMIAVKFSRILSGKALELQHWEDVVGYARLAEKLCKGIDQ